MISLLAVLAAISGASVLANKTYVYGPDDVANGIYRLKWNYVTGNLYTETSKTIGVDPISSNNYIYWQSFTFVQDEKRELISKAVFSYRPWRDSNNAEFFELSMNLYSPISEPPFTDAIGDFCSTEKSDQYNVLSCVYGQSASINQPFTIEFTYDWLVTKRWTIILQFESVRTYHRIVLLASIDPQNRMTYLEGKGEHWVSTVEKETTCSYIPENKLRLFFNEDAIIEAAHGYPDSLCYNKDSLVTEFHPKFVYIRRGHNSPFLSHNAPSYIA